MFVTLTKLPCRLLSHGNKDKEKYTEAIKGIWVARLLKGLFKESNLKQVYLNCSSGLEYQLLNSRCIIQEARQSIDCGQIVASSN